MEPETSREPVPLAQPQSDLGCLLQIAIGVAVLFSISALGLEYFVVFGGIAFALWYSGPPGRIVLGIMLVVFVLPIVLSAYGYPEVGASIFVVAGVVFTVAILMNAGTATGSDRGASDDFDGL